MISSAVKELVNYGEKCGFLAPADRVFTVNRIIDAIGEDSYEEPGEVPERELHEILGELTDHARPFRHAADGASYAKTLGGDIGV